MKDKSASPFRDAKPGDWIITDSGRCHQIKTIEEGDCGGVVISKYLKYFWNGTHIDHNHKRTSARMATADEIESWQRQEEEKKAKVAAEIEKEREVECIRDAAPDLLAACEAMLMKFEHSPLDKISVAADMARAAIAKARGK